MISLDVAEYCDNCAAFEPICRRLQSMTENHTYVYCENKKRCEQIAKHIERKLKAKDESENS